MLVQVYSTTITQKIKKFKNKKEIKRKLELAFNFLSFYNPIFFSQLKKQYQEKSKDKKYLRLKIKTLKYSLSKYFYNQLYNKEQKKEKILLALKHYFYNLKSFNQKNLKDTKLKSIYIVKSPFKYKDFSFLLNLIYLEDFLNV